MKQTDQTLLEQMRITEFEIDHRKDLFRLSQEDVKVLSKFREMIEKHVDDVVDSFYDMQSSVPEIALLIGDADTLNRLRNAQRKYVLDLFSGVYDLEYVNNRLRIGMVHKRIGVEPKLYIAAVQTLKSLLTNLLLEVISDKTEYQATLAALEKLLMFDVVLVFETYVRSLIAEIVIEREKTEQYARALEGKVRERTKQLEELTRTDPLTGLFNRRYLEETLSQTLRSAQRRAEPVTLVYIDVNDFKTINDTQGHQRGDEVLQAVAAAIKSISRHEDGCFRYGGDEFCIILPNCTEEQARELYLNRLKEALSQREENVLLSTGFVQTGPIEYVAPEALIRQADQNMYAEKMALKAKATR